MRPHPMPQATPFRATPRIVPIIVLAIALPTALVSRPAQAAPGNGTTAPTRCPDDSGHHVTTRADTAHHATRVSNRILGELRATSGVPGLGAAVWRDGRIIWCGSAGHRDLENDAAVTPDTIFRLASVSKVITATAAARLREDGRLDVDVPVSTMVPGLRADWAAITPRQLAAHVSGLPHYQDQDADRGGRHFATVTDAVDQIRTRPLLSAPGSRYQYSSWGYTLLSASIERAAGEPFLDYLRGHIIGDLAIGPDATDSDQPNASRAYRFVDRVPQRAPTHDFSYTWAGGGLGATPSGIVRFGGRLLHGDIVSADTLRWMRTPTTFADGTPVRDEDYTLGFGWRVSDDEDGAAMMHHTGVTLGARSALVLWPEQDTAVSLLSNAEWVSSIAISARVLAAPFHTMPATLPARDCPLQATHYVGRLDATEITGAARFTREDGLCIGRIVADTPLRTRFDAGPQRGTDTLTLVGFDANGGLSRAALVTPMGAYDLRAGADGSHAAALGVTRRITLRFE